MNENQNGEKTKSKLIPQANQQKNEKNLNHQTRKELSVGYNSPIIKRNVPQGRGKMKKFHNSNDAKDYKHK